MSKVNPVLGMLIVVPLDKVKKGATDNPFANMVVSNNLGTVKYRSDESDYAAGELVYFGSVYERLVMEGVEVLAMKEDNIFAFVDE